MAAVGADEATQRAPRSRRAQAAAAFAGLAAALLVLASVPLLLSPPVGLTLAGPSLVPVGEEVEFSGRFTLAGFGLAGGTVEVRLDDALLQRVSAASDGSYTVRVRLPEPGPHVLQAFGAPGSYTEATTQELHFRAVHAPPAPTNMRAEPLGDAVVLRWTPAPADEDRPVQSWRVYARAPGMPWTEVASLAPGVVEHRAAAGSSYAVAAANVAGESAWVPA